MGDAGENLLGHVLGPAVGVGAAACAAGLLQGHFIVGGINRGGGGEDDILHAHLLHHLGQNQGGVQIVVVILPGLFHAFAHCLQPGEMDHTGDVILREDFPEQPFVPDVPFVEGNLLAGEGFHPLQGNGVGIAEIIDDHHAVSAAEQLHTGMGADITGAAGNQNIHTKSSLKSPPAGAARRPGIV